MTPRTGTPGGEIAAQALAAAGIRHAFCVPGESYLPLLATLKKAGITPITCRHEGTASMAAEAMGRLRRGVPGLCLVTRAPGLANAIAGINLAMQDATPLVVLAGQVPTHARGTQAFQEAELTALAAPLCKHVEEVSAPAALAPAIMRACHIATSGTPGPVMLSLPEDVLNATAQAAARIAEHPRPHAVPAPTAQDMARLHDLLGRSARPLLIAGGGPHMWTKRARALLHELAQRAHIPLITAFRRQGLVDPLHPAAAGTLGFRPPQAVIRALRQADLLILLGTRVTAITRHVLATAFDLAAPPMPVAHIHPDAEICGRNIHAGLPICAVPEEFLQALPLADIPQTLQHAEDQRRAWTEHLHAAFLDHAGKAPPVPAGVNPGDIFIRLREHLPPEAIVCSGAGNYALWLHRFFHHRNLHGQLAPVGGVMGYGLPAALAAKLRFPDRPVLAVAGDGCLQMSLSDFATAAQYGLGIIVLVLDNAQLGTIRLHQLRRFPDTDCATALHNPDFAAFAESCGGLGLHVRETEEFMDAFRAAENVALHGRPALLHIHVSPDAIAPGLNADDMQG